MDTLIGLSPILFYIVLVMLIIWFVIKFSKKGNPNNHLEKRIRELEEENENLRNNKND